MADRYSKLLEEVADELRQLARRAPDIAQELHRFSDDLDRLASKVGGRDDASSEGAE
jgi:hypothetical protein